MYEMEITFEYIMNHTANIMLYINRDDIQNKNNFLRSNKLGHNLQTYKQITC